MKLWTEELMRAAPPLYSGDGGSLPRDRTPVAKFFHPMGRATWFVLEASPTRDGEVVALDEPRDDVLFFGYMLSPLGQDCDELGYWTLSELESVKVRGLRIERDLYFTPQTLRELGVLS